MDYTTMSEKQRTSMSLETDVIEMVEDYQDREHLDNRSEAMSKIVRESLTDDGQELGNSSVTMAALTIAGLALLGTVPFLVFLVFDTVPILPALSAIVIFVIISLYFSYVAARSAGLSLRELVIIVYFPMLREAN